MKGWLLDVWWLRWEMPFIDSHIWTFGPQLVAPFGKVMESEGGEDLQGRYRTGGRI